MSEKIEKQAEKQIEEKKQEMFIGSDLKESYMFYRNYISNGTIEEYIVKRKLIEIGKELLPTDLKSEKEQKHIDIIYDLSCSVLKTKIPGKRKIAFSYVDQGEEKHTVYTMKSTDAAECNAETEKLDEIKQDFREQQYESKLGDLQNIDNQIFHELVRYEIVKKEDPSFDKMKDEMKKEFLNDIMNMPEPKLPEPETKEEKDAVR